MSETQKVTIADFLLARYAEDEAKANDFLEAYARAKNGEAGGHVGEWYGGWWAGAEATGFTPQRILAECEAKRRIVEACEDKRQRMDIYNRDHKRGLLTTEGDLRARHSANARWAGLDVAVRLLALPYADHPDFNPEWRF